MSELPWFERELVFGKSAELLPYFLERLAGTIVRIEYKVKNIPEDILSRRFNGKWSIKENIGHLAEVDEIANKRIEEMTTGVSIMSPAVFEPQDFNPWPIEKVVQYFEIARKRNLEKYRRLHANNLLKSSLHPRLKVQMTPVDLAWFDAEHDDHHLVKINQILQSSRL